MKRLFFVAAVSATGYSGLAIAAESVGMLSSQGGRFVYGQTNDLAVSARMLDTQTGRLWESFCIVKDKDARAQGQTQQCLYHVLEPIYFRRDDGSLSLTPDGKKVKVASDE